MRRLSPWLPALAWAGTLFVFSSRSTLPGPDLSGGLDKATHFGAYAVLGFLLAHAVRASGLPPAAAVALGWAYGASDEWHQSFVPGRAVEAWDLAADALGVLAGVYLFKTWRARRERASAPPPGSADFLRT